MRAIGFPWGKAADGQIAALTSEMDAIHFANELYWQHSEPTLAARAEYHLRKDRLEKIRAELAQLRSA